MISTRDLSLLPDVDRLRALMQSLAMLDAILCPEWEYRYYSFNAHWSPGEMMGSMRDGEGDDYHTLFTAAGAILKGFAHEAPMSPYQEKPPVLWPGVLDSVPPAFAGFLATPGFGLEDTTFCIWRTYQDSAWQRGIITFPAGADPDGSAELLQILDGEPRIYQEYAEEYYETPVSLAAIRQIYAHQPLTQALVTALNPDLTLVDLAEDIAEIGYPFSGQK